MDQSINKQTNERRNETKRNERRKNHLSVLFSSVLARCNTMPCQSMPCLTMTRNISKASVKSNDGDTKARGEGNQYKQTNKQTHAFPSCRSCHFIFYTAPRRTDLFIHVFIYLAHTLWQPLSLSHCRDNNIQDINK
jgi:hypothetical protein